MQLADDMTDGTGNRRRKHAHWGWWLASALLAMAALVDAVDGDGLKLATSLSWLGAALLGALTTPPRPVALWVAVLLLAATGVGTTVLRLAGVLS